MDHDGWVPVERLEVATGDEAEAEEFVRQAYPDSRTRFHGAHGDHARITIVAARTDKISADHVRSTVDYSTVIDPLDYVCSLAPYHGRLQLTIGREVTVFGAGQTCLYPMGLSLDIELSDLGIRTIRLPRARLGAVAEEAAGIAAADLRFDATTPVSSAASRRWAAFIELSSGILVDDAIAASPVLIEELTRTAAITALHTFPNTALAAPEQPGPGWVALSAARRAGEFIDAHAGDPVTVEEIASAAGVSSRVLRHAFRRYFDTTPTQYLQQVRLEHAMTELRDADPSDGVTVAQVAQRWGWASPSRFTAAYRERFEVLPSHTLRG